MTPERAGGPPPTRGDPDSALLSMLVDSVTEYAIFALDVDGHVRSWNHGAEHVFGLPAERIRGRHLSTLHPDVDGDVGTAAADRSLAIAVATGRVEDEGWRVRGDGSRFWADEVLTALRGDDGRLLGFGAVVRDLTERKTGEDFLRESEERFRLLVTAVADYAIFLLNPDGTVASWNNGAERLKGYRADEIIGRHFSTFYTGDDRAAGVPASGLEQALAVGRWESEGWRVRKDGTRFWANVVITALRSADGTHRGFAKVTRDLTERKRGEDALRGVLERERDAAARLREVDRMKTDLVAVVAHDIRAPVGVLQSLLDVLDSGWDETSDDEKRELVQRSAKRVTALASLVDHVFDVSRIEAGELAIATGPIDVVGVIRRVVADVAVEAPERLVGVEAPAQVIADGDEQRVWQVVTNLVANAVKFSPPDTPVTVVVGETDDDVVVSVVDRGPGIPEDQQHLLFERFSRLPRTRGTPGSGLGLYIVKSVVEAHGGRVWFEPTPGGGTTFSFSLPVSPSR